MTTVNGSPIRRSGSRRALASAALVLLAGLVATVCASRWIRADAMRQDTACFGSLARSRWDLVDERERAWLVACAGGALSLALALLMFVQGHGRARAEELADELAESRELLKAGSEERARLSRQLHDDTIQTLFEIGLMLGRTRKEAGNREVVEQRLNDVSDQLDRAIADLRHYVLADSHIGPHEPPPTLARALDELARRWKLTHTAEFQLQADPETGAGLPPHAVADILIGTGRWIYKFILNIFIISPELIKHFLGFPAELLKACGEIAFKVNFKENHIIHRFQEIFCGIRQGETFFGGKVEAGKNKAPDDIQGDENAYS